MPVKNNNEEPQVAIVETVIVSLVFTLQISTKCVVLILHFLTMFALVQSNIFRTALFLNLLYAANRFT